MNGVNPDSANQFTLFSRLEISCEPVGSDLEVWLEKGAARIQCFFATPLSVEKVTCWTGFLSVAPGQYDLVVKSACGMAGRLPGALTVRTLRL